LKPIVHGLQAQYGDRILFTYLDVDDARTNTFKSALGYRYQPELYLLDGSGSVVQKWIGFVSEAQLVEGFAAVLE
jgi:hypothetical protein